MPNYSRDIDFGTKMRRLKQVLLVVNIILIASAIWSVVGRFGSTAAIWVVSVLAKSDLKLVVVAAQAIMVAGAYVTSLVLDPPRSTDEGR